MIALTEPLQWADTLPSSSSSIRTPIGFGGVALRTAQNLTPVFSLSPLIPFSSPSLLTCNHVFTFRSGHGLAFSSLERVPVF